MVPSIRNQFDSNNQIVYLVFTGKIQQHIRYSLIKPYCNIVPMETGLGYCIETKSRMVVTPNRDVLVMKILH